jgi:hypothetical protein
MGRPPRMFRVGKPERQIAALRVLETEANGRTGATLGSVGCATGRAKYRNQGFGCVATDLTVSLDRPDRRGGGRTGVALRARRALRTLRALRPLLPLRSRHALYALSALRAGGSLGTGLALRSWIPPTAGERHRRAHHDGHYNASHTHSSQLLNLGIRGAHLWPRNRKANCLRCRCEQLLQHSS